ncbi:baseplate assembly protein [Robbsia andropogonis]|uniref:baseplate assembly protein n=1 Tax=Robbsia andropogonis TaxID=28092 RepID=UPI0020A07B49|nr:baseplate J/gp47 family protein [Robbsia andropogonis]MCP1116941.1 baseplate J/gp47 family protein [Robbsia andropogonis]MCP1126380.1 baseplate J/gp47 family protein [Robbsia andropogonis]
MKGAPIDLSRLPAPEIVETLSFESILAQRKARLISLYPAEQRAKVAMALELESEPMHVLLQENAYREVSLRQRVNDAARALLLAYARGGDLEHLAALMGVERQVIIPAQPDKGLDTVREPDEALRERTQLAPQGFSVAGPEAAYRKHARDADGRVLDASVISPAPCEVQVTILSREPGGKASDNLIQIVATKLQSGEIRPLTDKVSVRSAQIIDYAIRAALHCFPGPDARVVLQHAQKRLARYIATTHRLGRAITLSGIYAALHVDGVARVALAEPTADIDVPTTHAARCTRTDVTLGDIRA